MLKHLLEKKHTLETKIYALQHNPSFRKNWSKDRKRIEINNYKLGLITLKNHIYYVCEHDWIDDIIDINPEKSKKIEYCEHCLLLRRNK